MENDPATAANTPNQQTDLPSSNPQPMTLHANTDKRTGLIILVVGASIILAAVLVILIIIPSNRHMFFGDNTAKPEQPASQPSPSSRTSSVILPIDRTGSYVNSVGILYSLGATFESTRQSPQETELITNINNTNKPGFPKFIVTPNTTFSKQNGEEKVPTSIKDLQAGQHIIITLIYNIDQKTWNLANIYIVPANNPQASASATLQN